mmetsp:Transcript_15461/g.38054  ORF Transcript_15461/g.38054 Transcript_15461/m.38054 type:complete len:590 (+) Transcript_15461:1993-3762(+)
MDLHLDAQHVPVAQLRAFPWRLGALVDGDPPHTVDAPAMLAVASAVRSVEVRAEARIRPPDHAPPSRNDCNFVVPFPLADADPPWADRRAVSRPRADQAVVVERREAAAREGERSQSAQLGVRHVGEALVLPLQEGRVRTSPLRVLRDRWEKVQGQGLLLVGGPRRGHLGGVQRPEELLVPPAFGEAEPGRELAVVEEPVLARVRVPQQLRALLLRQADVEPHQRPGELGLAEPAVGVGVELLEDVDEGDPPLDDRAAHPEREVAHAHEVPLVRVGEHLRHGHPVPSRPVAPPRAHVAVEERPPPRLGGVRERPQDADHAVLVEPHLVVEEPHALPPILEGAAQDRPAVAPQNLLGHVPRELGDARGRDPGLLELRLVLHHEGMAVPLALGRGRSGLGLFFERGGCRGGGGDSAGSACRGEKLQPIDCAQRDFRPLESGPAASVRRLQGPAQAFGLAQRHGHAVLRRVRLDLLLGRLLLLHLPLAQGLDVGRRHPVRVRTLHLSQRQRRPGVVWAPRHEHARVLHPPGEVGAVKQRGEVLGEEDGLRVREPGAGLAVERERPEGVERAWDELLGAREVFQTPLEHGMPA